MDQGKMIDSGSPDSVVTKYLNQDDSLETGNIDWKNKKISAPGDNEHIRYRSMEIGNQYSIRNFFYTDEEISVTIEYEILKKLEKAWLGISITTRTGDVLLHAGDHQYGIDEYHDRLPGIYRTKFTVPKHFLNEGRYYLGLVGHIPGFKRLVSKEHIIAFDIIRSGAVSEGRIPGMVLSNFKWETKKLD